MGHVCRNTLFYRLKHLFPSVEWTLYWTSNFFFRQLVSVIKWGGRPQSPFLSIFDPPSLPPLL